MAYGRISYKGPLAVGRTNPTAAGTLAVRGMAKAGLGGKATTKAKRSSPVKQQQEDKLMAQVLGLRGAKNAKIASKGRQNQPVKKQAAKPTKPSKPATAKAAASKKTTLAAPKTMAGKPSLPKVAPSALRPGASAGALKIANAAKPVTGVQPLSMTRSGPPSLPNISASALRPGAPAGAAKIANTAIASQPAAMPKGGLAAAPPLKGGMMGSVAPPGAGGGATGMPSMVAGSRGGSGISNAGQVPVPQAKPMAPGPAQQATTSRRNQLLQSGYKGG